MSDNHAMLLSVAVYLKTFICNSYILKFGDRLPKMSCLPHHMGSTKILSKTESTRISTIIPEHCFAIVAIATVDLAVFIKAIRFTTLVTHHSSLVHSELKTFLFHKSFPP